MHYSWLLLVKNTSAYNICVRLIQSYRDSKLLFSISLEITEPSSSRLLTNLIAKFNLFQLSGLVLFLSLLTIESSTVPCTFKGARSPGHLQNICVYFSLCLHIFTSYYIPEKPIKRRMEKIENVNTIFWVTNILPREGSRTFQPHSNFLAGVVFEFILTCTEYYGRFASKLWKGYLLSSTGHSICITKIIVFTLQWKSARKSHTKNMSFQYNFKSSQTFLNLSGWKPNCN